MFDFYPQNQPLEVYTYEDHHVTITSVTFRDRRLLGVRQGSIESLYSDLVFNCWHTSYDSVV